MYIEETKKERFVSFTGENSKSSQGSYWMLHFDRIIVHNLVYGGAVANTAASLHLTVAYEAA